MPKLFKFFFALVALLAALSIAASFAIYAGIGYIIVNVLKHLGLL
ncbi:MAG TPA: hypothetical protein VK190_04915 [Pseudoneobacillus sp.]|nr:hypothetical protein [Pseudoneobacillus sp.]